MPELFVWICLIFAVGCNQASYDTGAAGGSGPKGSTGAVGPVGPSGPAGLNGAVGPAGAAGPAGPMGPMGPAGAKGATGANGSNGATGAAGAAGAAGPAGPTGPVGPAGVAGPKGDKGDAGVVHKVTAIPVRGACVSLGNNLWVENEGSHADVYNNSYCDHGPSPRAVLCDDLEEKHICWVGNRQFSIAGIDSNMCIHELSF